MGDPVFERYKEALKQGHVAVLRGRPKEALARYDEAARLADHRALPYLSMGSVLLELGRAREALESYDRAIQRSPADETAHRGRAAALRALGRHAEADAMESERARAEAESADHRVRAEAAARSATYGEGPGTLISEADDAIAAGDRGRAVDRFEAAAAAYLAQGTIDAALDACERAVAIDAAATGIHIVMVRAYLARSHTERAVERLVLLDRLLGLEMDEPARTAVTALCREHRDLDPRLAAIADAPARPAGAS